MELRLIDEMVMEHVMGWKKTEITSFWSADDAYRVWHNPEDERNFTKTIPYYSEYISDSWVIVEHLAKQGKYVQTILNPDGNTTCIVLEGNNTLSAQVTEKTVSMAICKVALKIVGKDIEGL